MTASVSTTKVGFSYTGTKNFTIKVPKCYEYTVEDFKVEYADGKNFGEYGSGTLTASAVLVLVRYDANGAMIDVNYEAVALTNELAPIQTSISVAGEANGETVEAFLWTDMAAKKLIDKNILTFTK